MLEFPSSLSENNIPVEPAIQGIMVISVGDLKPGHRMLSRNFTAPAPDSTGGAYKGTPCWTVSKSEVLSQQPPGSGLLIGAPPSSLYHQDPEVGIRDVCSELLWPPAGERSECSSI